MATPLKSALRFIPRREFQLPTSLPRSYFLGHHKAGLDKMKQLISQIELVIECRDYRIPITGENPLFEKELGFSDKSSNSRKRIIVYTKCDLGQAEGRVEKEVSKSRNSLLTAHHFPTPVHFSTTSTVSPTSPAFSSQQQRAADGTVRQLLRRIRQITKETFSLTGHRVLIAGMPNAGKSTLLNALRKAGIPGNLRGKKKVVKTGADPGVTRAVSGMIKILEADEVGEMSDDTGDTVVEAKGEPVYVLDTPGIFPPYVPDATNMLKLSLCGCVKDSLLPPTTVADFLLFNINIRNLSDVYKEFSEPTNDVGVLLTGVAKKTGRLGKGGDVDIEGSAVWFIKRWRQGRLGRFVLDDISEDVLNAQRARKHGLVEGQTPVSWNQAVKKERERRREKTRTSIKA